MKQNLSATTIIVVIVVVLIVVGIIGWKVMAGKSPDVDPNAVDEDPAMMKTMQESMKKGESTEEIAVPSLDGT